MAFNLTTSEVAELLRTSDTTLRRLRQEGILKPGIHFRAVGPGRVRPALLWDGDAADAALAHRSRKALK